MAGCARNSEFRVVLLAKGARRADVLKKWRGHFFAPLGVCSDLFEKCFELRCPGSSGAVARKTLSFPTVDARRGVCDLHNNLIAFFDQA